MIFCDTGDECPECDGGELEHFENASAFLGNTAEQRAGLYCENCGSSWYENPTGDGYLH